MLRLLFHSCRIAAIGASVHALFTSSPWGQNRNIATQIRCKPKASGGKLNAALTAAVCYPPGMRPPQDKTIDNVLRQEGLEHVLALLSLRGVEPDFRALSAL